MIFLRFISRENGAILFDLPVTDFDLDFGLNQSTGWSASVPLNTKGIEAIFEGMNIEFYVDGELFFEGIFQSFQRDLMDRDVLKLSGRSFLDNLYAYSAYALSYYDDVPLLGVLTELLEQAGWTLGDISTLDNVDQEFSKDMRGEKNLLTQINKVLEGIPFTYWREGVNQLDKRAVDIGLFNRESLISALFPADQTQYAGDDDYLHTLTSFSYSLDFSDAVYGVRPEGGKVKESATVERVINLGDALVVDPLLRVDDEFQIIEDLNERAWSLVNVRDYPYPGGRVLSSEETKTTVLTIAIGDVSGGAVENWRHLLITFIPYPGIMRHFTIWLGTVDASFTSEVGINFDMYWKLFEVDPADNRTLISDPLHTQVIPPASIITNRALRIEPDTDILLEPGKLYGLVFGTTVAPTADVVRCALQLNNRASISSSFGIRVFDTTLPVNGSVFGASALVPIIEVVTDPVGTMYAGFVVEKQPKFAPPQSGSAAAAAEIGRAGYSLYLWAINYLIEHPALKKDYTAKAVGTKQLVPVGDKLYVRGNARLELFDDISGLAEVEIFEEVDDFLRVTGYSVHFKNESIDITYKLLDGEGIIVSEQLVALYDIVEDERPPEGDIWTSPWGLLLDTITTTIGPAMPNAQFADGTDAYEVVVSIFDGSVPSLPTNTEWVYLAGNPYGTSTSGVLRIEVIEIPEFTSTGQVTFLVGFTTRGWLYGDTADLTVKLIWR